MQDVERVPLKIGVAHLLHGIHARTSQDSGCRILHPNAKQVSLLARQTGAGCRRGWVNAFTPATSASRLGAFRWQLLAHFRAQKWEGRLFAIHYDGNAIRPD